MLYTVQNADGEVYGTHPLPEEPGLTAQEWAERLHEQLEDIEGINGITANRLMIDSRTREEVDRVTIDIEPWERTQRVIRLVESERLERVHRTIGVIARGETFETPVEPKGSRLGRLLARVVRQ